MRVSVRDTLFFCCFLFTNLFGNGFGGNLFDGTFNGDGGAVNDLFGHLGDLLDIAALSTASVLLLPQAAKPNIPAIANAKNTFFIILIF